MMSEKERLAKLRAQSKEHLRDVILFLIGVLSAILLMAWAVFKEW